jgi:hypothetical protein
MDGERGSARRERAARNQAMFREVNERLEELAEAAQSNASPVIFACECADLECVEQLELKLAEYEQLRSGGNAFAVAPGHVDPEVEQVEREDDHYVVVAKLGEGGRIAQAADPRSRTRSRRRSTG